MAQNSREGGRNEMLGVARYRLEGNFMAFLTCVMTRVGGTENEFDVNCDPLGSPGTPFVGRNRESMESDFDTSQVTRFKNWRRATHHSCTWSSWKLSDLQSFALTNTSFRDFPLRYDMRGGPLKIFVNLCWFCVHVISPLVFSSV